MTTGQVRVETASRALVGALAWDRFVTDSPNGWFWHTSRWIDYCLAYHPGAMDASFAVCDQTGRVLAVVPMVVEGDRVAMGGHPCAGPIGQGVHVAVFALQAVDACARHYGIRRVSFREQPRKMPMPVAVGPGWRDISWGTHVLDLFPGETELWRGLRKSYHSLVRKAEKTRTVLVTCQPWVLDVCHALHRAQAGRETRAQATWDMQRRWLETGDAVVALVSGVTDPDPEVIGQSWVGFAYAVRWKRWAYYASGATEEPNVAHALQWALIKSLRAWGATHYELGWADAPGATAKEQGISHFKAGWGGELWTVPACERSY